MADKKARVHPQLAERIVKALPPKVKAEAEVKAGGGPYSIIRVRGRSIASVRDNAVRVVHPTDGSADSLKALAKLIAEAAPEAKPKADKKAPKSKAPKGEEPSVEAERAAEAEIETAREAEGKDGENGGTK
jgi:hypothetical protein